MNIAERTQKILLQPQQEWLVIDSEPTTPGELYAKYIIPLAAIAPIALIIGFFIYVGRYASIGSFALNIILLAAIYFALTLAGVYALALVIDALAPSFAGSKSTTQALKVAAYSLTPLFLGGIFYMLFDIEILRPIVGLYGLFLLFLGLPILMKSPKDKAVGYVAVAAIAAIVIFILIDRVLMNVITRAIISALYGI
ncbi:MAG TPA: YIP1 family protein [Blastocatellia bacterium]|nr:YIP1 family protein [Blastocatellia bacterium]